MKRTIGIAIAVTVIAAALLAGVALAQGESTPEGGRGPGDGSGELHEYMVKAMADAVGLSQEAFEVRHDAGETFYQIALAEGYASEEIPALMRAAREKALDAAASDGVITAEQAEWMQARGAGHGGMMDASGYGRSSAYGDCPMADDSEASEGAFGAGHGGRWR